MSVSIWGKNKMGCFHVKAKEIGKKNRKERQEGKKGHSANMMKKMIGVYRECRKDNIGAYSAQSAFFIILSALPFAILMMCLLRYTTFKKEDVLEALFLFCPNYLSPMLTALLDELYDQSIGILSVSAVAAIWSAAKGIQSIGNGLNKIYDVDENRNWFTLRFWAILYTLVFAVSLLFLLGFMVFEKYVWKMMAIKAFQGIFWKYVHSWTKWLVGIGILFVFFTIMYTFIPNKKLKLRRQCIGALFTAVGWFVFSYGLSVYVNYFNGFSMYGNLTTLVLLMLWVYFCMYILMIGAEINAYFSEKKGERKYSYRNGS